tara:strand:+ start:12899 stop:13747 length:849 start_codon:yes stop_codon:yes gene_type:complete
MFERFGLSPLNASVATSQYLAGAAYIHFGNLQRDSENPGRKAMGYLGKEAAGLLMQRNVREAVSKADHLIGAYEANHANLDSYTSLVRGSGEDFFRAIVYLGEGDYKAAAELGGDLAVLTSLDDNITNRATDVSGGRFNPLISQADLRIAEEMFSESRERVVQTMSDVLNNESLESRRLLQQAKGAWDYIRSTKGKNLIPLGAAALVGCECSEDQTCEESPQTPEFYDGSCISLTELGVTPKQFLWGAGIVIGSIALFGFCNYLAKGAVRGPHETQNNKKKE